MGDMEDITRRALELKAQERALKARQLLEREMRASKKVARDAQITRDKQAGRQALLAQILNAVGLEVIEHLKKTETEGDSLHKFKRNSATLFGDWLYWTITDDHELACWEVGYTTSPRREIVLRSDGKFGRVVRRRSTTGGSFASRRYDRRYNRHRAGAWLLGSEYYREALRALYEESCFKEITERVLAASTSEKAFDDQFCNEVFGTSKGQIMLRLAPKAQPQPPRRRIGRRR